MPASLLYYSIFFVIIFLMKKRTYSNPWDEIEARANNYSSKALMAMVIVVLAVWLLTLCGFFIIDKDMMTRSAITSIIGFLALHILLRVFDNSKKWLKYVQLAVICILCGALVSALSFHALLVYVIPLIFAAQYSRQHVIWATLAFDVIVVAVSSLLAFYYGLCDLNIFFVSMGTYDQFSEIVANGFQGLEVNADPTFIILVYATIPRAMILSLFAYMLSKITEKGRAEAAQLARTKIISETDFVTGVYNKNKYIQMINDYYPKVNVVAVIFWDINNLKEVNDELGHEMGDKVIAKLAETLLSQSDEKTKIYRVGGDEFLSMIENPALGEEEEYEDHIVQLLSDAAKRAKVCVSVAHGSARGQGSDINRVVNEADAAMYACKREMKGENN